MPFNIKSETECLPLICFTLQSVKTCDLNHRNTTCPMGYCCARDEFILEDILCKPLGKLNSVCSTVPSDNECPCIKGLVCKADLVSGSFVSIYGHCHNITIDNTPTTQSSANDTKPHNFPPQIHLSSSSITVPITTTIGTTVLFLNVTDNDNDTYAEGKLHCDILNFDHFIIEKISLHRFEVKVALSLKAYVPQQVLVDIHCEDDGKPPTNNVAVIAVYFVYELTTPGTTSGIPSLNTLSTNALRSTIQKISHRMSFSNTTKELVPKKVTSTSSSL